MARSRYSLTAVAEADLDRLYDRGIDLYGLDAANRYYDGLIDRFLELAENPGHWQSVDHIRAGYRRSIYGIHSIITELSRPKL